MIDNFSLFLTHGLLLLAAWRLMSRADLDREPPPEREEAAPPGFRTPLRHSRPRGDEGI